MIAFVVAGSASGVGKTTVALTLMTAFRERGDVVQPFKCGPDFLDPGHHGALCGRLARNLDTWMLDADANRVIFESATCDADVAIVEGMMGLFDGVAAGTEEGSTAQIAKLLHLPVILVLDAAKSARSIAAVVKGFESFDPALHFAGIVLNGVSSSHHYRMLETAIASVTEIPLLGRIPRDPAIEIPERHLGLQTIEEQRSPAARAAKFAELARQYLDLTPLVKLAGSSSAERTAPVEISPVCKPHLYKTRVRIGLPRDKAFSFYYEDNLDLLRERGADIIPFSPLADEHLPANLDCLYLGGGYPELYAEPLSRNRHLCAELRSFVESCRPVYAECGGMVYLGRSLTTLDGTVFPMSGVLPLEFEMTPRLVQFGYVDVEFVEDCLLGEKGTAIRGHSFHCSRVRGGAAMPTAYRLKYSLSGRDELEGFQSKNVLASYVHLHFRGNSALAPSLVAAARRTQARSVEVPA